MKRCGVLVAVVSAVRDLDGGTAPRCDWMVGLLCPLITSIVLTPFNGAGAGWSFRAVVGTLVLCVGCRSVDLHPTEPWVLASLFSGQLYIWHVNTQSVVKVRRGESECLI